MILHPENWMNIRRFRALHEAGASYAEIAAEVGCDWRTVKRYLSGDVPAVPPAGSSRKGTQPRKIAPFEGVIDSWLRADIRLRASVICERLAAGYGYDGSYQRVKLYVAEVRPKIAAELAAGDDNPLAGLHRRFAVAAGAQAQVDWGEESGVLIGTPKVYSFHMVLSYSRDPFCCYTARTDLAAFFGCHIRAFEYFGGVPGSVVYDRTKTVVQRHVAPGKAVPLHPEAVAFAGHYGFDIDVLAAYRPTGKGRVERQVDIARAHVLAGRAFCSLEEMDAAFLDWAPIRRGQVHRTHGEVIGGPGRGRPGGAAAAARGTVPGRRAAPAPGRQGLPDLVRGQHVLGARPAGAAVPAGARPGRGRQGRDLRPAGRRRRPAGRPRPRAAAGQLRRGPGALGRAARRPHPRRHSRCRRCSASQPARRRGNRHAGDAAGLAPGRRRAGRPPAAQRLRAGRLPRHDRPRLAA